MVPFSWFTLISVAFAMHSKVLASSQDVNADWETTRSKRMRLETSENETPLDLQLVRKCEDSDIGAVMELVEKGANVNSMRYAGISPLMAAAAANSLPIVNFLLEKGASPNPPASFRGSALIIASYNGNLEMAQTLLQHGANPMHFGYSGTNALMLASQSGNVELVGVLLDEMRVITKSDTRFRESINLKNHDDRSALSFAARAGHKDIVSLLLASGADKLHEFKFDRGLRPPLTEEMKNYINTL